MPTKKPPTLLTAAEKRAYTKAMSKALSKAAATLASAKNDPSVAVEAARARVAKSIDNLAARTPSTSTEITLAKRGNFRPILPQ